MSLQSKAFAFLTVLAFSGAAAAQQTEQPKPAAPAEKKICKSEATTGSIMKKKTCRTKAEWDAMTAASRNDLNRLNDQDRSRALVDGNR